MNWMPVNTLKNIQNYHLKSIKLLEKIITLLRDSQSSPKSICCQLYQSTIYVSFYDYKRASMIQKSYLLSIRPMEMHKSVSLGQEQRQNLPINLIIYTKDDPIYYRVTASILRDYLNSQFKLKQRFINKNIQCTEIKYTVEKNQSLIKLGESLKAAPFVIDTTFNRFDCSDFAKQIFKGCDTVEIENNNSNGERLNEAKTFKEKMQIQFCNKLEAAIQKMMKIYNFNGSNFSQPIRSNASIMKMEDEKNRDQIKISGFLNMKRSDYFSTFENYLFFYDTTNNTKKCSQFFIKPFIKNSIKSSKPGKQIFSLFSWKIGFIHKDASFVPYFDNEDLSSKLNSINGSVQITSGIMKESGIALRKFEVYSTMFDGLIIKFEIRKVHISHIYVRRQGEQNVYYIKMDYPPKFFGTVLDAKLNQQTGHINTWKRVQNFTIVDHDKIKNNELLRLHLFNNVIIRLVAKKESNKKSINFLQDLYKQMSPNNCSFVSFVDNKISLQNIFYQVNYDKFINRLFSFQGEPQEIDELKWNLKYMVICLISRGLLSAFLVEELINFVQQKKKYKTFIYIFDKLCDSEFKGDSMSYIKKKFVQYQQLSQNLLDIDNQSDCIAVRVWRVQITPSGYLYCNKAPQMKSRMQRQYEKDINHFIRASIVDDDGNQIKNQVYLSKKVFRSLISGFKIVNRKYIPLGWSPSQLRSFSLWFMNEYQNKEDNTSLRRSQVLSFLGEFQNIHPPAKMAARIGQAFSSSWAVSGLGDIKTNFDLQDIKIFNQKIGKQLLFTDGIGKISSDLIGKIQNKLKLHAELGAIQVRYLGAKGVLVVDGSLPKKTIQIRPSMKKYDCNHSNAKKHLDILDWNKYKAGFLNRQTIILLKSLGVSNETFMDLQKDYIKDIQSLTYKECSIFKELASDEHNENLFDLQPVNKIILWLMDSGFDLDNQPFFRGVMQILKRNGYQKLKEKSNINVKKSARLMGVIDEYKVLEQNSVYCRIVNPLDKQNPDFTLSGHVILVRNPCLHPADIRKVRAFSEQQIVSKFKTLDHPFKQYPNTVIMTQKGNTPITSAISGSDLDGDNFWICWDQNLMPSRDQEPFIHQDYSFKKQQKDKLNKNTVDEEDYKNMLDFFCQYMNYDLLGKIANSHLIKADQNLTKYAYDQQCIQLAMAHGHAVDFPKSGYCPSIPQELLTVKGYPDFMQKQDDEDTYISESILGHLYRDIKSRIQSSIIQNAEDRDKNLNQVRLDADLISIKPDLVFQPHEVEQALKVIYMFAQDIERIKFLANLDSEFQIYTGNVTSKTKGKPKKNKGFKHGKLMQQIIMLKQKYQGEFFMNDQDNIKKYKEIDKKEVEDKFSQEIKTKAALWYSITYVLYFGEKLVQHQAEKNTVKEFKALIGKVKNDCSLWTQDRKQLGLVWFAIPKVLMEMKKTGVKNRKQAQKIAENSSAQKQYPAEDISMSILAIQQSKIQQSQYIPE